MEYKLSARVMSGSSIVGYQLIDEQGKEVRIKKDKVEQLAAEGLISDCSIIDYNGKKYLKTTKTPISSLPVIDMKQMEATKILSSNTKLRLTNRLVDKANKLSGYIAKSEDGKEFRLGLDETWRLCRDGAILNAKAQISDKAKMISGIDIDLRSLPTSEL